jgi:hypothetical protein
MARSTGGRASLGLLALAAALLLARRRR